MNVLFVTEYFPTSTKGEISGGVEARCFYMARELSKKHKVKILCSWRKGQTRKNKIGRIDVERVGPNHEYSNKGSFISRLGFSIAAYNALKKEKGFDVFDGFSYIAYIPAYFAARKAGARAVATYHETWVGLWIKNKGLATGMIGELIERIVLKLRWNRIIPVSNFTKKKLEENGIKPEVMEVVYNGVNSSDIKKINAEKEGKFRIVCVSRLVKTKRAETIFKALELLKDREIKLVLVGEGDDKDYLKSKVKEMKLQNQVRFTGFLKTKDEVIREIKRSHVLCHPSAIEGFGITVIEGMAAGLPVICSDIPPLMEVTENGKYGLVFRLDDYHDLAEKIKMLKNDRKKYEEMKEKALKRAKDFEWEKITKEYLKAIS